MSKRKFLLIKNLDILNANALSSPYTIGFPAISAWLGAMHALERHLKNENLVFKSIGVACHDFNLQTYKKGRYHSIICTKNPLGKDGKSSSIIQEARCHLKVSLLIEYNLSEGFESEEAQDKFKEQIKTIILSKLKIAGGTITNVTKISLLLETNDDDKFRSELNKALMPSFMIIERKDLIIDKGDTLEAILDCLKIVKGESKELKGWIVPIATGFAGISPIAEAGKIKESRDSKIPHIFAEPIVTLGEFKMPYRIENLDDMLWSYRYNRLKNLYFCTTDHK